MGRLMISPNTDNMAAIQLVERAEAFLYRELALQFTGRVQEVPDQCHDIGRVRSHRFGQKLV